MEIKNREWWVNAVFANVAMQISEFEKEECARVSERFVDWLIEKDVIETIDEK
jgi:hypothetical protein